MKRLVGLGVALLACVTAPVAVADSPTSQDLQQQFELAAGPTAKIQVDEAGWHRVSFVDLKKAGFAIPKNTANLQLYAGGKQVRIRVAGDGIEFFGVPLDTNSTDRQTYWLAAGTKPGLRIRTLAGGGSGRVVTAVPAVATNAPRNAYYAAVLNGEGSNLFGSDAVTSAGTKLTVSVPHLASSAASIITVALQGYSAVAHRVRVSVDGTQVGTISFTGQIRNVATLPVPAGVVKEGDNDVSLQATAGEIDFSLIDFVSLSYNRLLVPDKDVLAFTLPAGQRARLDGFSRASAHVVDVTDPAAPTFLQAKVGRSGKGYRITIGSARKARQLVAFTDGSTLKPVAVTRNSPSSWNSTQNGADLVIISHSDFLSALPPLVAARKAQGLKVAVVNVEDIYDEFGFGAHGPEAIKAFLSWTRSNWKPAPHYVLLVGDATFDPLQKVPTTKEPDFVPTKFLDTAYLEVPSDDWFADFNNDGAPEMAVGRFPVDTLDQAKAVVAKIVRYDTGAPGSKQMLLVSDSFKDYDFEAASRSLFGLLPSTWTTTSINRREGPSDSAVHARTLDALNQGPTVVNFFGHGAIKIWTSGSILTAADAPQLRNGHLSLYVMMTCLNGYFVAPGYASLGETLLSNPSGGAVAVWSSTGETVPTDQILMDQKALGLLFSKPETSLGDAMLQAKASVSDPDVRRTWVLFGDPTTRLH